jgi:hypothetical protein
MHRKDTLAMQCHGFCSADVPRNFQVIILYLFHYPSKIYHFQTLTDDVRFFYIISMATRRGGKLNNLQVST